MAKNEWRLEIAAGSPVTLDSLSYMVDEVASGWATLRAFDGTTLRMPLRQLAKSLTTDTPPPPLSARIVDVEDRMSEKQLAKVAERRAIVRWFETGLRPEQSMDDAPDACHDPTRVASRRARVRAMAEVLAERRGILIASASQHINRILDKATLGDAGLLDPRMLAPQRLRKHEEIEGLVREFLLDREYLSTIGHQSLYMHFAARARSVHGIQEPAERTFERALQVVYKRYPHLKLEAKSRASAATAPSVATGRRSALRVGEFWFVDATKSNVMIRDPYAAPEEASSYRLIFTKILEAASRSVVGRSLAKDMDGYAAGLALADAFRGMVDERDAVVFEGRTRPRPLVGLPRAISRWPIPPRRLLLDNGREFLNKHCMWTLHRLGIDVEPQRVTDGRGKGRMERHFGTNRTNFEELQFNYVSYSVGGRGPKADKEVILTWDQLFARDIEWCDMYNFKEHRGLFAETGRRISPTERWIELAEEFGITEIPSWRNEWIRFLPHQVLALNRYGVERRGLVYKAPVLGALLDVDGAAPSGKVRVFWDPNDLRQLYCFDPEGNAYELPWVYRTEDSQPFTDFALDWAIKRLAGTTRSKQEHRRRLVDHLVHWQHEDVVLLAQLRGRKNAEEILGSQLESIRDADLGSIVGVEAFVSQDVIDAMRAKGDSLELDDEGIELLDDGDDALFEDFG